MSNFFYKPKHMKPNPTIVRFKKSPKWILEEIKWYLCFWLRLGIKAGKGSILSMVKFIDFQDNFRFLRRKKIYKNMEKAIKPSRNLVRSQFPHFLPNAVSSVLTRQINPSRAILDNTGLIFSYTSYAGIFPYRNYNNM